MSTIFSTLVDLLYPPRCLLCRRTSPRPLKGRSLCTACTDALLLNRPPFCAVCSLPLNDPEAHLCPACARGQRAFDRAWGALPYTEAMQKLIHLFKYRRKTALRRDFAAKMLTFAETYPLGLEAIDLIVPVPLHPARLRERGFNQSEHLALAVARAYGLPLSRGNLRRRRATPYQARLKRKQRWTNIQGAFKIIRPEDFDGKHILIIDDLFTTGATSSEIARLLKQAGAQTVTVFTLAITAET